MKYIMFETPEGVKYPIIFPEALTHLFVAGAMQMAFDTLNPNKDLRAKQCVSLFQRADVIPINAGFVEIQECTVHGVSESLGDLPHGEADEGRIILGSAIAMSDDEMVIQLVDQFRDLRTGD